MWRYLKTRRRKMSEAALLEEAVRYFHAHEALRRLADLWKEKYRRLGRLGGSVFVPAPQAADQRALEGFLRCAVPPGGLRVSCAQFADAWARTKFATVAPQAFVRCWAGGTLLSRREEAERQEARRLRFLTVLRRACQAEQAQRWLAALAQQRLLLRGALDVPKRRAVRRVATALCALPDSYERLPFFANRVLGDPHGFDLETEAGVLLLQALAFLRGAPPEDGIEGKSLLLYEFHLLRDDLFNFVSCVCLRGFGKAGEILYWREAAKVHAPLNLPLREIVRAERLAPLTDAPFVVFVVENSGVFSALLDRMESARRYRPLVCLHGQCKMASWALLDRLVASGATLCYSGDFDPEGILIAQQLLRRCGKALRLWHFSRADYRSPSMALPEARLRKLQGVDHPQLRSLAEAMARQGRSLYQESFVEALWQDVESGSVPRDEAKG